MSYLRRSWVLWFALVVGPACGSGVEAPVVVADASVETAVCPAGQLQCGERCVDPVVDRANCGACGTTCAAGQVCSAGKCGVECPTTLSKCGETDARCVDTKSDRANCGACGTTCAAGEVCSAGKCAVECATSLTKCGETEARCVDTKTDRANCGACGTTCAAGEVCSAGKCGLECAASLTLCDGGDAGPSRCVDTKTDPIHCGACGTKCSPGTVCSAGACETSCGPELTNCSGSCREVKSDPANCNACGTVCPSGANATAFCASGACGIRCAAGFGDCNGIASDGCETALDTALNCRACGVTCTYANASGTCGTTGCAMGACNAGFKDCNGSALDGCETNANTDRANCGACGNACPSGQVCSMGACTPSCGSSLSLCGGVCADTKNDPANCGSCGTTCASRPNTVPVCSGGGCGSLCTPGFADCNSTTTDGCESSLNSTSSCGKCGNVCPTPANAASACTGGICGFSCNPGYANCNGITGDGCEAPLTTTTNCGTCGNTCAGASNATATCSAGSCALVCNIGFADCNSDRTDGCETPINTNSNCGACGRTCAAGESCSSGACVKTVGYTQSFTSSATPIAQCTAWNSFRASLTGTYTKATIYGSSDPIGVSCTGPGANTLCQALRSGTATSVTCGSRTWRVGTCGTAPSGGPSIEINAMNDMCSCHTNGYVVRPCIGNDNWGGANTATCTGPSQTLSFSCE